MCVYIHISPASWASLLGLPPIPACPLWVIPEHRVSSLGSIAGSASCLFYTQQGIHTPGFPGGSDATEPACNAGGPGSIPRSGRSPGKGMATHSSIPAWRILWTEEPGGPQSVGSQRAGDAEQLAHQCVYQAQAPSSSCSVPAPVLCICVSVPVGK